MDNLIFLIPIVVIELTVRVIAFIHCINNKRSSNAKIIWLVVIALISFIGWVAYIIFGTDKEPPDDPLSPNGSIT